jgi:flagellar biosynthesis chaperone FliJ
MKFGKFLFGYCLAVFTIFQAVSFPANDVFLLTRQNELVPLPTVEDIEEIMKLDNEGEKYARLQKHGVETAKHLIEYSKTTIKEVDELVKQSEEAILRLKAQSNALDLEEFEFTKNFLTKFNDARSELLKARRELVSLASKTVLLCNNIEITINEWQDEHAKRLLKSQFKQLARLIKVTKTKLTSAKDKYAVLIDTWVDMDEDIQIFKYKLKKATDDTSEEYKAWTTKVRAGSYGSVGGLAVAMIIADCLGCSGICTASVTAPSVAVSLAVAETQIAKYGTEIKMLAEQVDNAINHLMTLDQATEAAVILMNREMNLVIKWEAAADNVKNTIEDYTVEEIAAIKAFRSIYAVSIAELKKGAQDFYDFAITTKPTLKEICKKCN